MSRAFIKEDVDLPERSGRKRSASGLPPGATNYITARGAKRLRDELQKLRAANAVSERVTELEQILTSVHVVDPPDAPSNSVTFGATVTVKDKKGATETLTIVGVDELNFKRDAVSWISPLGKALLAADMGDWIKLDDGRSAKIVKIEFKTGSDVKHSSPLSGVSENLAAPPGQPFRSALRTNGICPNDRESEGPPEVR